MLLDHSMLSETQQLTGFMVNGNMTNFDDVASTACPGDQRTCPQRRRCAEKQWLRIETTVPYEGEERKEKTTHHSLHCGRVVSVAIFGKRPRALTAAFSDECTPP